MSVLFSEDGRDRSWMDYAACANHPQPDLWYPDNTNVYDRGAREAATICSTCPVRTQCFEFGSRERYGIYGGVLMTTKQRIQPLPKVVENPHPRRPPPRKRAVPKAKVVVVATGTELEPALNGQHPAGTGTTAPPVAEEELIMTMTDAPEPDMPEESEPVQEVTAAPGGGNPISRAINTVKGWLRL